MAYPAQKPAPAQPAAPDWVATYYSPEPANSREASCSGQDALSQMFAYYEG